MNIEVSTFAWVPPFAQGLVRDLRVRWALEEAGLRYVERPVELGAVQLDVRRSLEIPRDDAEEVAQAALFLASDHSSSMQAAEIVIDGGASRAPQGAPAYRV